MSTKDDRAKLDTTFKQLDLNGDGLLTLDELQNGYNKVFGLNIDKDEITNIFNKIDTDKSGTIDYSEFVAASIDRKKMLSKKRLERIFKMFDKDCSGTISSDELKSMFGANQDVNTKVWDDLLKEADNDGNGEVISFLKGF
jgi:calcium-dependent protein kinase